MNRRSFFKDVGARVAVLASAGFLGGFSAGAPARPPQSLRDLETVRAEDLLAVDIKSVQLNGRSVVAAKMNVAEGWVDVVMPFDGHSNIVRYYGRVTYTLTPKP